jgi:hypothetical protein
MAISNATAPTGAPGDEPDEVLEPDAVFDPVAEDDPHPRGVPGLARATVGVLGHTGSWAVGTSFRAGKRVVGVVTTPASSLELARDVASESTRVLATVVQATDLDRRLDEIGPVGALVKRAAAIAGALSPVGLQTPREPPIGLERRHNHGGQAPTLREQGEELLRRSRDVNDAYDTHPAYARILSELAPDEARVLQLMLIEGPQPTVDVRTGGPIGLLNSRLIASGLSMIGARAGCRYIDRVPSYLNNLFRLGLIWFSRETLRSHQRYQVLEAQPDVLEAIHSVPAAKVVRRSVHLTPFGEDFCRFCFTDGRDGDVLPEHSAPREIGDAKPPPETFAD